MSEKKAPLRPTRSPRPEDLKGAGDRARKSAARLREKYPGHVFPDSTEFVREDRDSRS